MKHKVFLLLYGLGIAVHVNIVGQLSLSEILAFVSMPFTKIRSLLTRYPVLIKIGIYYALLLVSLMLSDIANESSPEDYLRGWATVIFSVVSIFFLVSQLSKHPHYCVYYLMGCVIIYILWDGGDGNIDMSLMEENTNYFKARLMRFVNPAVLLLSYWLCNVKRSKYAVLLLFAYALFCIVVDARSNSLAYFTATLLLFIKLNKINITLGKAIFVGLVSLCLGYFAYIFYVDRVLYHDFGGQNAQKQLAMTKNPYNPFELLFIGRMDVFIAIEAIKDRPLIGYGSWGKDPDGKYQQLSEEWSDRELTMIQPYIKSHSVLFTAWLWGGLGGLIFILLILSTFIKMGVSVYKKLNHMGLLVIILPQFIEMIWHFLFSPFGYIRTLLPFISAFIIVCYYRTKQTRTC